MNRGEAVGMGLITACFVFLLSLGIWYYLIIDNLIIIGVEFGYDLVPLKDNIWWMVIGLGLLAGIRAGSKAQRYARKDICKHCGKDI